MRRKVRITALGVLIALVGISAQAVAQAKLYVIRRAAVIELMSCDPDGANQVVVATSGEPYNLARGGPLVFWANRVPGWDTFSHPGQADFDSISTPHNALSVNPITLDVYIAWNSAWGSGILKSPAQGRDVAVESFSYDGLIDVYFDSTSDKLFWAFLSSLHSSDGVLVPDMPIIKRIEVDESAGKLYYLVNSSIHRMNLDGSAPEVVATLPDSPDFPVNFTVDSNAGEIYWTGDAKSTIYVIDLNGNSLRQFDIQGDAGAKVWSLAIYNGSPTPVDKTSWGGLKSRFGNGEKPR